MFQSIPMFLLTITLIPKPFTVLFHFLILQHLRKFPFPELKNLRGHARNESANFIFLNLRIAEFDFLAGRKHYGIYKFIMDEMIEFF